MKNSAFFSGKCTVLCYILEYIYKYCTNSKETNKSCACFQHANTTKNSTWSGICMLKASTWLMCLFAICTIYNKTQFTVEISLKVNLFMWVEPIVAMFINERNLVGGAEQRLVNHIIFEILFCHLGIEFYFLFARGVMNDRGSLVNFVMNMWTLGLW